MQSKSWRTPLVVAALVASAGILAGGLALRPALANGGQITVGPFTVITCNSTAPCQQYTNQGTGAALLGKTGDGVGLRGVATANGEGVLGISHGNKAVDGQSINGTGINGFSKNGTAVAGGSTNSYGVTALSFGADGMYTEADGAGAADGIVATTSGSGYGVLGVALTANPAILAEAGTGDALYADADGGGGGQAAIVGNNANGNGSDISGTYIGDIARTPPGVGFPFVATDSNGNDLFFIDSAGDVFYHGTLNTFAKTHGGQNASAFETKAAIPSEDDWGSAQLVNGMTTVRLDPTFAQTLDPRQAYQVMLTPDADTRGLFVAAKTPTSFVVREVQGGHGTFAFDYHVYAVALGHAGQRMSIVGDRPLGAPVAGRANPITPRIPKRPAH
ncbi:MAG TPA: hypothetical protein VII69_10025 [Candidatus Eremiobacteraceae bacterium]